MESTYVKNEFSYLDRYIIICCFSKKARSLPSYRASQSI